MAEHEPKKKSKSVEFKLGDKVVVWGAIQSYNGDIIPMQYAKNPCIIKEEYSHPDYPGKVFRVESLEKEMFDPTKHRGLEGNWTGWVHSKQLRLTT